MVWLAVVWLVCFVGALAVTAVIDAPAAKPQAEYRVYSLRPGCAPFFLEETWKGKRKIIATYDNMLLAHDALLMVEAGYEVDLPLRKRSLGTMPYDFLRKHAGTI